MDGQYYGSGAHVTFVAFVCLLYTAAGDLETPEDRGRFVLEGRAEWFRPLPWTRLEARFSTGQRLGVVIRLIPGAHSAWFRGPIGGLDVANPGFGISPISGRPEPWSALDWSTWEATASGAMRLDPTPEGIPAGLYQVVPVPAMTELSVSVWAASLAAAGRPRLEVLPATDDEVLTSTWDGSERAPMASAVGRGRPIDTVLGNTALRLTGGASATLDVPAPAGQVVRMECLGRSDTGRARLTMEVRTPDGQRLAARTVVLAPSWGSVTPLVAWVPHEVDSVILTWSAAQTTLSVDNLQVGGLGTAFVEPSALRVEGEPIPAHGPVRVVVEQPIAGPSARARAREFAQELMVGAPLVGDLMEVQAHADPTLSAQSYYVTCDGSGRLPEIHAADSLAAAYALSDLREMIAQGAVGSGLIPVAFRNQPVIAWRGARLGGGPTEEPSTSIAALGMARFTHLLPCSPWWGRLGDPEVARQVAALLAECSEQDLVLIPVLELWGESLLRDSPALAVTTLAEETVRLEETRPALLASPNTVVTERKPIVVTSEDGRITYAEGTDYLLVPGVTAFSDSGYDRASLRWGLVRTESGRIRDGQVVRVTHHYVGLTDTTRVPPDLGEPAVVEAIADDLRRIHTLMHPPMAVLDPGPLADPPRPENSGRIVDLVRTLALRAVEEWPGLRLVIPSNVLGASSAEASRALRRLPHTCTVLMQGDEQADYERLSGRGHHVLVAVQGDAHTVARAAGRVAQWSTQNSGAIGLVVDLPDLPAPVLELECGRAAWSAGARGLGQSPPP